MGLVFMISEKSGTTLQRLLLSWAQRRVQVSWAPILSSLGSLRADTQKKVRVVLAQRILWDQQQKAVTGRRGHSYGGEN